MCGSETAGAQVSWSRCWNSGGVLQVFIDLGPEQTVNRKENAQQELRTECASVIFILIFFLLVETCRWQWERLGTADLVLVKRSESTLVLMS